MSVTLRALSQRRTQSNLLCYAAFIDTVGVAVVFEDVPCQLMTDIVSPGCWVGGRFTIQDLNYRLILCRTRLVKATKQT